MKTRGKQLIEQSHHNRYLMTISTGHQIVQRVYCVFLSLQVSHCDQVLTLILNTGGFY